jgi:hypothetical protein
MKITLAGIVNAETVVMGNTVSYPLELQVLFSEVTFNLSEGNGLIEVFAKPLDIKGEVVVPALLVPILGTNTIELPAGFSMTGFKKTLKETSVK